MRRLVLLLLLLALPLVAQVSQSNPDPYREAIRRGQDAIRNDDLAGAEREFRAAIQIAPRGSLAYYRLAEVYFLQRNYQGAANEYRAALSSDHQPKWTTVWCHVQLGKIFDLTGQRERAKREYEEALATGDNTAGALDEASRYDRAPYQPGAAGSPTVPTSSARGTLTVQTMPAAAQVYVDDVFRGTSSEGGHLTVPDVPVGVHSVRLTAPGYKEVKQNVTVSAGANPLTLTAERAGPKPLTEPEVEKALRDGIPKHRLVALVKEYGVDFELTDELEQSLRAAGADDAVLLAVSKSRKK